MFTPVEKPSDVELDILKEEESSGETRAFQTAMVNLHPGPFFEGPMICLFVTVLMMCLVSLIYTVISQPLVLFTVLVFPPVVGVLTIIFWVNDRDKATFSGIAKFYLLGILSIIPVLIIEFVDMLPFVLVGITATLDGVKNDNIGITLAYYLYMSFFVAAFTEENAKFISYFCLKKHEPTITHPYTVVILMASFALGFATFENYVYIFYAAKSGNLLVTVMTVISRAILSLPLHTVTGILIGCHVTKHFFKDAMDCKIYWQALWLPFLIHGGFDVFAFIGSWGDYYMLLYIVNIVIVLGGMWLCYIRMKEVKSMIVDQQNNVL